MKNIFTITLAAALLASCGNESTSSVAENKSTSNSGKFSIIGKLNNSSKETVYLIDVNSKEFIVIDSSKLDESGNFRMETAIPEKGFYKVQMNDKNFALLVIDTGEAITLTGDAKDLGNSYKVDGSPDSKQFMEFNNFISQNMRKRESISKMRDSLVNTYQAYVSTTKDKRRIDSLSMILEPVFNRVSAEEKIVVDEGRNYLLKFVNEHPESFASISALNLLDKDKDFSIFMKVNDALKAKYPSSNNLKPFYSFIAELNKLAPGSSAPDFKLSTPDEKFISLSSFKGKYVLVDFWASWCRPCRAENPNVVAAYKKYHPKGLEILGVSLDKNKDAWVKAIKDDHLSWTQVSDLNEWHSVVVPMYGLQGIPANVLLNKEGKIIDKNLRGEFLEKKLEEIFNAKL